MTPKERKTAVLQRPLGPSDFNKRKNWKKKEFDSRKPKQ